jgi:Tol biopolymer transport system component
VNLTNDLAEDFDPAWSPDGSQIVFSRSTGAHFHLYKMDADGSDVVQLTDLEYNDAYVAWSPDGEKIGFTRFDENGSGEDLHDRPRWGLTDEPHEQLCERPGRAQDGSARSCGRSRGPGPSSRMAATCTW